MLSKELIIRGNKTIDMIEYFEGIAFKEYNEKISFMKNDHHETFTLFKYSIKTEDWLVDLSQDKEIYKMHIILKKINLMLKKFM